MNPDDKDIPVSSDFKKSEEGGGYQLPDFLTSTTGAFIGLGVVVVVVAIFYAVTHVSLTHIPANPLSARPGFAALQQHVMSLAEVDALCAKDDRTTCLCQLAERIRDHRKSIDTLLETDPSLKAFSIAVRRPASETISYDLARLPQAPGEAECLNAVSAPTINDDDADDAMTAAPPADAATSAPAAPAAPTSPATSQAPAAPAQ